MECITYEIGLSHDDTLVCWPNVETFRVHRVISVLARWYDQVTPQCVDMSLREIHLETSHNALSNARVGAISPDEEVKLDVLHLGSVGCDLRCAFELMLRWLGPTVWRFPVDLIGEALLGRAGFFLPDDRFEGHDLVLKVAGCHPLVEEQLCRRLFH